MDSDRSSAWRTATLVRKSAVSAAHRATISTSRASTRRWPGG